MAVFEVPEKNIRIVAKEINIDEKTEFGRNINIKLKGEFRMGKFSNLGNNTSILGNNVSIGMHLFNSSGLTIGGGGRQHPNANFSIGDRCTIHNNFINVCEEVVIGNDVGLSPDTSILTHGYWLSVLEGFPATFSGVKIGNGVIVGYRSLIMMGVEIADYCVVGAQSVVAKSLTQKGIYAGVPAKFIKEIKPLEPEEKVRKTQDIIDHYLPIAKYHELNPNIVLDYPYITVNDFRVNVETFEYSGIEDDVSDDFRDYVRKWGIRIYTERPFRSHFTF
ncbi:MAG TPA: acyltransferase [Candidatus Cloacimonadota bacterium]|nr:acyltransferase [Candidatus Cloacimonadota bacterium]HPT70905.1 acyltransferase [Candidatus Cloacimonadota bacterium]